MKFGADRGIVRFSQEVSLAAEQFARLLYVLSVCILAGRVRPIVRKKGKAA